MANTTTTTAVSVINSEWIAEAMRAARASTIFMPGGAGRSLPGIDFKSIAGMGTTAASWPIENSYTAYDVAENVDHTLAQAYTPTDNVATVTEKIAIEVVTKMADRTTQGAESRAFRMLGQALGEKMSSVVYALHTSFDTDSGSTGAAATWTLLAGARNSLEGNNYSGPYTGIIHPQQWFDIVQGGTVIIHTSSSDLSDFAMVNYQLEKLAGINLLVDPLIPSANAGEDRSGAVYSNRPAVGVAMLWELEFDTDSDASARNKEYVGTQCYGVVEVDGVAANGFETDL